ncbi:MAG: N-acetylglucosamine-6-phosphate deacetylase [Bacteroidetes bacterium]|nr:N-acetylglucosamine-6-phosphate deacetylase [Bacteroidota bacterium]
MRNRPRIKIYNGKLITPYRIVGNATLVLSDGIIQDVFEHPAEVADAIEIDAQGQFIAPGFIDIHIHGGGGADFMDATPEAFLQVAETHARYGTTALSPTSLTSEKKDILRTLDAYEQATQKNDKGAAFIGMHLEGPYFAMNQRGAQDPRYIRNPDPEEYKELIAHSPAIRRWSAAPELEGAMEFGRYVSDHGILASAAHTDAVYEDMIKGFENGYRLATHLYSGMSGVTRRNAFRHAGAIESALLIDEMDVEIIADGVHLPPALLQLVYKVKGADRIALITDAMRAAGQSVSESMIGSLHNGIKVIVEDDVAKLPDRSSFAGSIATADRLVRNMINLAGVPVTDAVRMMTSTPARIMGVSARKGSIARGKDADIVIFDKDINIALTIVNGNIVYKR